MSEAHVDPEWAAEQAHIYAETVHADFRALTLAVERVALALESAIDGEKALHVKQAGAIVYREDRP